MRPRLLLTIHWKFAVDFFARGLHTRSAVARLPLRQLGFLVQRSQADATELWEAYKLHADLVMMLKETTRLD